MPNILFICGGGAQPKFWGWDFRVLPSSIFFIIMGGPSPGKSFFEGGGQYGFFAYIVRRIFQISIDIA